MGGKPDSAAVCRETAAGEGVVERGKECEGVGWQKRWI
jgi:hypothetical protein